MTKRSHKEDPARESGEKERPTSRFEFSLDTRPEADTASEDDTTVTPRRRRSDPGPEANIILIAHPQNQMLGTRFRFRPGSTVVLGRAKTVDISLPEVSSLSRRHARLTYRVETVTLEDMGSTNGTFVNDQRIEQPVVLRSGDRFQIGSVHFKFLQERDVENAYHQAIHDMVVRDGLTQISNKRKFEEEADRELGRARRYGRPLTLVLFDLDHFKSVNDTHGHLCGDFVLKQIALLTRDLLRREQVFARVGGEEFAVLTPEATGEGARLLAERLRNRIARHQFSYAGATFQVTCSFGVAELRPDMSSPRELYEAADKALYISKGTGRNKVTIYCLSSP